MDRFRGKRVAIVGLSTEGQDAIQFFLSRGSELVCLDRRDEKIIFSLYPKLSALPLKLSLGTDYLAALSDVDIIVRTPGMALATRELEEAKKNGKEITSLTKLFFECCRAPIIGVTGTKGKGTTSTLIYEILKTGGKTVYLGGNVGTPLLSLVDTIKNDDWVVLELSSFQLEDLTQSPHISVVLTITQDHLANFDPLATNFHESRDAYVAAKKQIIRYQHASDIAIFHADDPTAFSFADDTPAIKYFFGKNSKMDACIRGREVFLKMNGEDQSIGTLSDMKIIGPHNLENVAAAALAAREAGMSIDTIRTAVRNFSGLPHRLQIVGVKNGVTYVDDSFSTTPETTIAAINSFDSPMILIVGGSEKGSDFQEMGKRIAQSPVSKVIVVGEMTKRITTALSAAGFSGEIVTGLVAMHDMVRVANDGAKPGDVILLSPACASFGLFPNYKERGRQFTYEVSLL